MSTQLPRRLVVEFTREGVQVRTLYKAKAGKIPLCVPHRDGRRYADALVVCRRPEFAKLIDTESEGSR